MTAVVAMPTALGVCAWLQVAHGNFLRLLFAHITLSSVMLGCVSSAEYFFASTTHGKDMITPRAKKISWQSSYASTQFDQERKSLT
jgi:hypothetical protein